MFAILGSVSDKISFKCMVLGLHSILFKVKYKEVVLPENRMNCFLSVFEWVVQHLATNNVSYSMAFIENLLSILNGESYDEYYKMIFAEKQHKIINIICPPNDSLVVEKWKIADFRKILQN